MVENSFGILVKTLRVLLTTMRPKLVMCGTTLHVKESSGGGDRPPTPAADIVTPQADHREQGQDENFIHRGRPSINKTYWKTFLTMWWHWLSRRIESKKTKGEKKLSFLISPFQDYPNNPLSKSITEQLSWTWSRVLMCTQKCGNHRPHLLELI